MKLRSGESPDVYLSELRRLASLFAGISDKALACAFVTGLPEDVRQLLRAGSHMEALDLSPVLARARAVIRDDSPLGSLSSEAYLGATAGYGTAPRVAARAVSEPLPSAMVSVEGVRRRVLVDTGCTRSIVHVWLVTP
ncbi:hypothetical protein O3P69_009379 [Scylla paramamosain]|uniref:Gag-pol polyprotein n=1 Tax=Scylla paramamosain TaxID=85552 RepID=A0AAW0SV75_SCYPA